jgi:hypothetical protein
LDRLKLIEEKDRQINMSVLKRELLNDSVQLPIKFLAYKLTTVSKYSASIFIIKARQPFGQNSSDHALTVLTMLFFSPPTTLILVKNRKY